MVFTLDLQLKVVNLLCQAYFFFFSFLTMIIFFHVTLPGISDGDDNTLHKLKIMTCFIYFNMWGNYFCICYKSRFSVVKPESFKSKSGLFSLALPQNAIYLQKELTMESKSAKNASSDIYNKRYLSGNSVHHIKEKWINIDQISGKDHRDLMNYTDTFFNNQKLNAEKSNRPINNISEYSLGTCFTYTSKLDKYNNDCSQQDFNIPVDISSDSVVSSEPILVTSGWSKCRDCIMTVPPRAKHCPLCRHCVLKRDHHCFFVGCCVGFHNQRFFIIFCLYAGIGVIYSSVVTLLYLRSNFEATYSWGYLAYLFPVVLYIWFMGGTSSATVGMIIILYWSIVTALICGYYFCVQIYLVYTGQTNYEYLKGIKTYQATLWTNITSVFGKYWLIGFIIPAPFLGYSYNGINWQGSISDNKIF